VDPATGAVLEERDLPERYFAEGLALVPGGLEGQEGDRLIQLTWKSGVALVWNRSRFEQVAEFDYTGQGWGLTFDGTRLVMSDGSSWLTFRDPETFEQLSRVRVTLGGRPLSMLNELEWVDGAVWANVWGSTQIVRIDPASGEVTATADLGVLYEQIDPADAGGMDVLNGIAYRPEDGQGRGGVFLVTGKYWPLLFEVTLEAPHD
jgi:glutaminyl-peptide cyclotransferase